MTLSYLSKHWHGIQQQKTNWADGTSFITQCPIPPNHSFLHQFSAPNQTGTFWFVLPIFKEEER
jgi:iron transport multicopper oxidase